MKGFVFAAAVAVMLMASSSVLAQGYATFVPAGPVPVAAYYAPAPVAGYGPVIARLHYARGPYYVVAPLVRPLRHFVAAPVAVTPGYYYGRPVVLRPWAYTRYAY
jgi:hypothetical protein